jgi:hypothetical protein
MLHSRLLRLSDTDADAAATGADADAAATAADADAITNATANAIADATADAIADATADAIADATADATAANPTALRRPVQRGELPRGRAKAICAWRQWRLVRARLQLNEGLPRGCASWRHCTAHVRPFGFMLSELLLGRTVRQRRHVLV